MNTAQLLLIIAAWCGQPVPYKLDSAQVNNCRNKIMLCVEGHIYDDKIIYSCLKSAKIGE